jgi:hypothetical protein
MLTSGRTFSRVIAEVNTMQLRADPFNKGLSRRRGPLFDSHMTRHDMLTPDLLNPVAA